MIHFDTTKARKAGHRSGLVRVSERLREALGAEATDVWWQEGGWQGADGGVRFAPEDWLFTPEVFDQGERPGFAEFLQSRQVRTSALFHDALPLKLPHLTWARSVARHPNYLKLLSGFDRVLAVSRASAAELEGYWRWLGRANNVSVIPLQLGCDVGPSAVTPQAVARPLLLQVGILEPRKNQVFTLEVAEALWKRGLDFELLLIGRVNPEFGRPVVEKVLQARKRGRRVEHWEAADDARLLEAYGRASLLVFPSLGEGCGLPVLEAMAAGVPVVCSDVPALLETAAGGGCCCVAGGDVGAWVEAVGGLLGDATRREGLRREALGRRLTTWAETAQDLLKALAAR